MENDDQPTTAEADVLRTIADYIQTYGFSPSIREIGQLGETKRLSTATVSHHISELRAKGFLAEPELGRGRPRMLRLTPLGEQWLRDHTLDAEEEPADEGTAEPT